MNERVKLKPFLLTLTLKHIVTVTMKGKVKGGINLECEVGTQTKDIKPRMQR